MAAAKKQSAAAARRARAEEMRRAEEARDRRNRIIAVVAGVVVLAGMVGGGWAIIASAQKDDKSTSASEPPEPKVTGEKTYGGLTQNHVKGDVDYKQTPPVGGDHDQVWQNCDKVVYDKPLRDENAVHGLEHGAVWITYNDKAADADIKALRTKVENTTYTFMSPYPKQPGTIMLTAWGHQLTVENSKDPRIQKFLDTYVQGEQTPEKGAACTGGKATAE